MDYSLWVWIDGTPLNGSLWMSGYPTSYHGVQSCAVMSAGSALIKNVDCRQRNYILCQEQYGKQSFWCDRRGESSRKEN